MSTPEAVSATAWATSAQMEVDATMEIFFWAPGSAAESSVSEEQAVAVSRRPPAARRAADARSEVCIVSSVRLMGTIVN